MLTLLYLAPIVLFAWWCILRMVHVTKTIRPLPPYRHSRDAIIPPPPKVPKEFRAREEVTLSWAEARDHLGLEEE